MHIFTYLFLILNELDEIFSVPQACKKMSRHFGQMQAVQEQVSFFFPNTWHFDHVITSIMWLIKWSIMNLIPEFSCHITNR